MQYRNSYNKLHISAPNLKYVRSVHALFLQRNRNHFSYQPRGHEAKVKATMSRQRPRSRLNILGNSVPANLDKNVENAQVSYFLPTEYLHVERGDAKRRLS